MSGFGAKVSLTAIIKNIIKDYPEGTQILKELLQNGDDAKARHMTFLFDRRSHGTSSVAMGDEGPAEDGGRRMAAWQGPALLVFDSAVFEPKDLESIQRPTDSKKKYDPTKTGKFGVGFNSVYHITDVVSFLSGRYLNVMDPHQKYCSLRGEPGLQYDITTSDGGLGVDSLESLDDIADTLAGFCPGFEWCPAHSLVSSDSSESEDAGQNFTLEPDSLPGSAGYPGTIMRLPLRTDAMAPHSDIKKDKTFTKDAMEEIFMTFRDEVVELLIFLRYVECIRLLVWREDDSEPTELLCASVVDPDEKLRSEREAINRFFHAHMDPSSADPRQPYAHLMEQVRSGQVQPPAVQTGLTISLQEGESQQTDRWLLALAFAAPESHATRLAIDSITAYPLNTADLKLVPWAMACARVAVNERPCPPVAGVPYTTMPIGDLKTKLPVHVNSGFELASNRRDFCWGRDQTGNDHQRYFWNLLMLSELIPHVYHELLLHVLYNEQSISYSFYDLFPPETQALDEKWSCIVGGSDRVTDVPAGADLRTSTLYHTLRDEQRPFLHPDGLVRSGEEIVLYRLEEAIFPDPDMERDETNIVVDFLRSCGAKIVTPMDRNGRLLPHIYREFRACGAAVSIISPTLVRSVVVEHSSKAELLLQDVSTESLVLLRYVLSDIGSSLELHQQLRGARLVPLLDGTLGTFGQSRCYITESDDERRLFAALPNLVVDDKRVGWHDVSTLQTIRRLAEDGPMSETLNLFATTPTLTAGLKHQFQPLLESESGLALAIDFWHYLRNYQTDCLSEFHGFSLLFNRMGVSIPLSDKALHTVIDPGTLDESLLRTLEMLGGHIAHADVLAAISSQAKASVVHPPSPDGVLDVLSACTNEDYAVLAPEQRQLLFTYFAQESHKLPDNEEVKDALKQLPLYELMESTEMLPRFTSVHESQYISLRDNSVLVPALCPPSKMLKPKANQETLLCLLDVQLVSKADILVSYGLDHLQDIGDTATRNTCMLSILQEHSVLSALHPGFLTKLQHTAFLPKATLFEHETAEKQLASSTSETLVAPVPDQDSVVSWIFDPTVEELAEVFQHEEKPFFPAEPFNTPAVLNILRGMGLPTRLDLHHVIERAESVQQLAAMGQVDAAQQRSKALLSYLSNRVTVIFDRSSQDSDTGVDTFKSKLRQIEWLPVAANLSQDLLQPADSDLKFASFEAIRPFCEEDCVGTSMPLLDESLTEKPSPALIAFAGWDHPPPLNAIIHHLKSVSELYNKTKTEDPEKLDGIAAYVMQQLDSPHGIYETLNRICAAAAGGVEVRQHLHSDEQQPSYEEFRKWVFVNDHWIRIDQCAYQPANELAPYLYKLPAILAKRTALLSLFDDLVKQDFEAPNYLACLERMSADADVEDTSLMDPTRPGRLTHKSITDAIQVLCHLAKRSQTDSASNMLHRRLKALKVPTDKDTLEVAHKCYYIDNPATAARMDTSDKTLVHPNIPVQVAATVGVRPLSASIAGDFYDEDEFSGQTVDLCAALRNILAQYPEGTGILKELLQNADDACAKEFHAVYDMRTHGTELLFAQGDFANEFQGPAILAWDDVEMKPENIQAIQSVAQSSKTTDYGKTGKFGIGFNSVYHVTDLPSFVSGNKLYIFDPHCKHLPGNKPGRSIPFDNCKTFASQFEPFFRSADCADDEVNFMPSGPDATTGEVPHYGATIFRLPFRTEGQAEKCDLGRPAFTHDKAMAIFQGFAEEADTMCMFLKHVKTIKLSIWCQGEATPRLYCVARAEDDDTKQAALVPETLSNPDVLSILDSKLAHGELIQADFVRTITRERFLHALPRDHATMSAETDVVELQESRYLVSTRLGTDADNPACQLALEQGKAGGLRLLPLAAIAAPLENGGNTSSNGGAFCFLPLPIRTGLPVHINAFFDVSTDRRSITQSCDDITDPTRALWNVLLRDHVIVPLYCHLLNFAKLLINNPEYRLQIDAYYRLFPKVASGEAVADGYFRGVAHGRDNRGVYSQLANSEQTILARDLRSAAPDGSYVLQHSDGHRVLYGPDNSVWQLGEDGVIVLAAAPDSGQDDSTALLTWRPGPTATERLKPGWYEWLPLHEALFNDNLDKFGGVSKAWQQVLHASAGKSLERTDTGTWKRWKGRKPKCPDEEWSRRALRNWSHLRQGLGTFVGADDAVSTLLLRDGLPLTVAPFALASEFLESAKHDSNIHVRKCSPDTVAQFYRDIWTSSCPDSSKCSFDEAPCRSLKSRSNVFTLLSYVLREQDQLRGGAALARMLEGLPLLPLGDSELGTFQGSTIRVFTNDATEMELLPNMRSSFVLAANVPSAFAVPEWQSALSIVPLTAETLAQLMNDGGALDPKLRDVQSVPDRDMYASWLARLYSFLNIQKTRPDEFAQWYGRWPLIPTRNNRMFSPNDAKAVLMPTAVDFNVTISTTALKILEQVGCPVVDAQFLSDESLDLIKHCGSSLTGPGALDAIELNDLTESLLDLDGEQKDALMLFFASSAYGTEQQQGCMERLCRLPLFRTADDNFVAIGDNEAQWTILPAVIPAGQVKGNFLKDSEALSFFFTDTLKIKKLRQADFLRNYVLPQFDTFDTEELIRHMLTITANWESLKAEDGTFVDALKKQRFLETSPGVRICANECMDPEVPLFRQFFARRFPGPAPFDRAEMLPFLREIGLTQCVSDDGELLIAAARAIERASKHLLHPFEPEERVCFRPGVFRHEIDDFSCGDPCVVDYITPSGDEVKNARGTVQYKGKQAGFVGDVLGICLDEPVLADEDQSPDGSTRPQRQEDMIYTTCECVRHQSEVPQSDLAAGSTTSLRTSGSLVRARSAPQDPVERPNSYALVDAVVESCKLADDSHHGDFKSHKQSLKFAQHKYDIRCIDGRVFKGVNHRELCVFNEEAMVETTAHVYTWDELGEVEDDCDVKTATAWQAASAVFTLLEHISLKETALADDVFDTLSAIAFLPVCNVQPPLPDDMEIYDEHVVCDFALDQFFACPADTGNLRTAWLAYTQLRAYVCAEHPACANRDDGKASLSTVWTAGILTASLEAKLHLRSVDTGMLLNHIQFLTQPDHSLAARINHFMLAGSRYHVSRNGLCSGTLEQHARDELVFSLYVSTLAKLQERLEISTEREQIISYFSNTTARLWLFQLCKTSTVSSFTDHVTARLVCPSDCFTKLNSLLPNAINYDLAPDPPGTKLILHTGQSSVIFYYNQQTYKSGYAYYIPPTLSEKLQPLLHAIGVRQSPDASQLLTFLNDRIPKQPFAVQPSADMNVYNRDNILSIVVKVLLAFSNISDEQLPATTLLPADLPKCRNWTGGKRAVCLSDGEDPIVQDYMSYEQVHEDLTFKPVSEQILKENRPIFSNDDLIFFDQLVFCSQEIVRYDDVAMLLPATPLSKHIHVEPSRDQGAFTPRTEPEDLVQLVDSVNALLGTDEFHLAIYRLLQHQPDGTSQKDGARDRQKAEVVEEMRGRLMRSFAFVETIIADYFLVLPNGTRGGNITKKQLFSRTDAVFVDNESGTVRRTEDGESFEVEWFSYDVADARKGSPVNFADLCATKQEYHKSQHLPVVDRRLYDSSNGSIIGIPLRVPKHINRDGYLFVCFENPQKTGLDNRVDRYVDAKTGVVSVALKTDIKNHAAFLALIQTLTNALDDSVQNELIKMPEKLQVLQQLLVVPVQLPPPADSLASRLSRILDEHAIDPMDNLIGDGTPGALLSDEDVQQLYPPSQCPVNPADPFCDMAFELGEIVAWADHDAVSLNELEPEPEADIDDYSMRNRQGVPLGISYRYAKVVEIHSLGELFSVHKTAAHAKQNQPVVVRFSDLYKFHEQVERRRAANDQTRQRLLQQEMCIQSLRELVESDQEDAKSAMERLRETIEEARRLGVSEDDQIMQKAMSILAQLEEVVREEAAMRARAAQQAEDEQRAQHAERKAAAEKTRQDTAHSWTRQAVECLVQDDCDQIAPLFRGIPDRFNEQVYANEDSAVDHRLERGWEPEDLQTPMLQDEIARTGHLNASVGDTILELAERNSKLRCLEVLQAVKAETHREEVRDREESTPTAGSCPATTESTLDTETGHEDSEPNPTLTNENTFVPSLDAHKRKCAHDCIVLRENQPATAIQSTSVREFATSDLMAPENNADNVNTDIFAGTLANLTVHLDQWVMIPTCSAGAVATLTRTEPEGLTVQFGTDSADNLYAKFSSLPEQSTVLAGVTLVYTVRAHCRYFNPYEHYITDESDERRLATMAQSRLPVSMHNPARQVALLAGVTADQTFFQRLDQLVAFFRGFRQKSVDIAHLETSLGSLYVAMCEQQAGVCRHRALCFVVTALAEGIVARYLASDTHAWVEVQVPQSRSAAQLTGHGLGMTPVPQWHRIDLGGGAANIMQKEHPDGGIPTPHMPRPPVDDPLDSAIVPEQDLAPDQREIDVDGEVEVPDTAGYQGKVGPGTAEPPPKGDPMTPVQVEAMLDDAERQCRKIMSSVVREEEGWKEPGCCNQPEWKEGMHLQKSSVIVEGMSVWLPERWLSRGLTSDQFSQARLFAQLLNGMVFATFEGLKRSAVQMFHDEQSSAIAFNKAGSLFFNLAYWIRCKHCDKPIEAMYFWFHTLAHEVAHNIEPDHGPKHNYVLQCLATRHFHKLVTVMDNQGHWNLVGKQSQGSATTQISTPGEPPQRATSVRSRTASLRSTHAQDGTMPPEPATSSIESVRAHLTKVYSEHGIQRDVDETIRSWLARGESLDDLLARVTQKYQRRARPPPPPGRPPPVPAFTPPPAARVDPVAERAKQAADELLQSVAKLAAIDRKISDATDETNALLRGGNQRGQMRKLESILEQQSKLDTERNEHVREVKAVGDTLLKELEGIEARAAAMRRTTTASALGSGASSQQAAEMITAALAKVPESVGKTYKDAAARWRRSTAHGC